MMNYSLGRLLKEACDMARIDIPVGEGEDRQRMWQLCSEIGGAAANFSSVVQAVAASMPSGRASIS